MADRKAKAVKASVKAPEKKVKAAKALPSPAMVAAEIVAEAAVAIDAMPAAPQAADEPVNTSDTVTITYTEGTDNMTNETIERVQETQKIAADRMQAAFGDMNERSKEAMERSSRVIEEMTDLARGNVEALVASSKVAARGVETLGQEVAEFGRKSFEDASAAVRSLAEVRSATDFFRMQSEFARTAFDNMVAESSKMSEKMLKLAGDVAEPITSRYSVAAERVKNIAA